MSKSKFLARWEMDELCGKSKGFLEFCKGVGMSDTEIEYYSNMQESITYTESGDEWVCDIAMGDNKKTHKFKLGIVNPEAPALDGSTVTIEPRLEGDNKLIEIATTKLPGHPKPIVTKTERTLMGADKMESVVTDVSSGASMTFMCTKK